MHLTRVALLLLLVSGLALNAGLMSADPGVLVETSLASDWGEPCSQWHPPACFIGSNSTARVVDRALAFDAAPAAVELLCFDAQGDDQVVEIEWQTATEFDTLGFHLLRSESEDGPFAPISEFIVHCDDGGMLGGYYFFEDLGVVNDQAYYYRLQEKIDESLFVHYPALDQQPLMAVAGLPTASPTLTPSATPTLTPPPTGLWTSTPVTSQAPTFTPIPTATASSSSEPAPTQDQNAPTAAQDQTPTPTVQAGSASTPVPTNTPLPTATRRPLATSTPSASADLLPTSSPIHDLGSVVQSDLPTPGYPLPEAAGQPLPTDDGSQLVVPSAVPFPADYVPPPTVRPAQLVTMTPLPHAYPSTPGGEAPQSPDSSPRLALYLGFGLSLLILIAGLIGLSRLSPRETISSVRLRGSGGLFPSPPDQDGRELEPLDDLADHLADDL